MEEQEGSWSIPRDDCPTRESLPTFLVRAIEALGDPRAAQHQTAPVNRLNPTPNQEWIGWDRRSGKEEGVVGRSGAGGEGDGGGGRKTRPAAASWNRWGGAGEMGRNPRTPSLYVDDGPDIRGNPGHPAYRAVQLRENGSDVRREVRMSDR